MKKTKPSKVLKNGYIGELAGIVNGMPPKTFNPKKLPNIIPTYTVSLEYGDKMCTQSSDDITEAILGLKPDRINNRTVFTLYYNGKKAEVMKTVPVAKRILSNPLAAQLLGRYLLARLRPV